MPKHIVIRDDVLKNLDEIKEEKRCSYSDAIDFLLSHKPEEMWIPEVNKRFFELEGIFPDLKGFFEVMRAITILFYRMPIEVKAGYVKEISQKLEEVLEYVSRLKRTEEDGVKTETREER